MDARGRFGEVSRLDRPRHRRPSCPSTNHTPRRATGLTSMRGRAGSAQEPWLAPCAAAAAWRQQTLIPDGTGRRWSAGEYAGGGPAGSSRRQRGRNPPRRGNDREGGMVGVRGFEPPTPASRTQYSTKLSYTPTLLATLRKALVQRSRHTAKALNSNRECLNGVVGSGASASAAVAAYASATDWA